MAFELLMALGQFRCGLGGSFQLPKAEEYPSEAAMSLHLLNHVFQRRCRTCRAVQGT